MLIDLDLNNNDLDALLRHCRGHQPGSGDPWEDRRLMDALETLTKAIELARQSKGTDQG
ncbi:hypothetical protein NJC38_02830 [Pseudomonas sp. 21LCFQ010]|uniref:hypothetical protein n=1 Tax=Pseudomonas sp. 21LCFQ010 TaxID=2957506 RepID=UPI00209713B7|nr:hypothetical protein [Pseudomonas sp. 21LCFQ010]MCO8161086.1 hypothetical protein [Pseudomonas sp. 21LCFQ010]